MSAAGADAKRWLDDDVRRGVCPPVLATDRAHALKVTPVSRETLARLDDFVTLLLKWQATTNLVAPATIPHVWTRHIADSLQLLPLAPDARRWIDLGSGGGFPGVVVACALADTAGAHVHMIESNSKKAAFLREAVRSLRLPGLVHATRIEDFAQRFDDSVDVVTARAVAPLVKLLAFAEPLLEKGAKALFPKGQDIEAELTEAAKYWNITCVLVPSKTSEGGRILVIERCERR
jgi:16S rRNA (guanine527-N7)-methyltransferase